MVYATVDDLAARWRPLTSVEAERATVLLQDAALRLDVEAPPPDPLTAQAIQARVIVSCEMVKRALSSPGGVGVESVQQGAGPFQGSVKFTNPTADLYLTKADRKLLGMGQKAFTIPMGAYVETYTNGLPIGWLP